MTTPPSPGSQRGAIRPPTREGADSFRPAARTVVRRPGVMDAVVSVAKSEPPTVATPKEITHESTVSQSAADAPSKKPDIPLDEKLQAELAAAPTKKLNRAEQRAAKIAAKRGLPKGVMSGGSGNRRRLFFAILLLIVLAVAGYVAYDTWVVNRQTEAVLSQPAAATAETWDKEDEAQDESEVPESALANYQVAPDAPRALYIDKLSIAARILPMGLHTDDSIQAPKNIFDAGWYTGSAKPGEQGALFIDGHASGATRQGLFAYLDKLVAGDMVKLEKGDGTLLSYRVTRVETVPLNEIDMREALSVDGDGPGLNLMTCTGEWVAADKTYDHRVVVYTQQV